jgi:hypothetical protein
MTVRARIFQKAKAREFHRDTSIFSIMLSQLLITHEEMALRKFAPLLIHVTPKYFAKCGVGYHLRIIIKQQISYHPNGLGILFPK